MDKQIEEIAKVIDNVQTYGTKWYPDKYEPFESRVENDDIAYELYNAGYRKIPEGAVVLTREEYERLLKEETLCERLGNDIDVKLKYIYELEDKVVQVRKEMAEKFAELVKMAFYYHFDELIPSIMADKIDEICKEITEGKV